MSQLSEVNNYGISGTRLAHQTHPSVNPRYDLCFCGRAYDMDPAADMVVVYGGVNDHIHGDAPFGEMGDTTPATFCGAVYFLMCLLRQIYGNKPVIFMTPARCCLQKTIDGDTRKLLEYVDVIVETGKKLDIPVLDLYRNLGLDPNEPECFKQYTTDGLHFNDAGHEVLARRLMEFIEGL